MRIGDHQPDGDIAAAPAIEVLRRCGDCQCFQDPDELPEGVDRTAWLQAGKDRGQCFRFPQSIAKRSDDFCFEFIPREGASHAG